MRALQIKSEPQLKAEIVPKTAPQKVQMQTQILKPKMQVKPRYISKTQLPRPKISPLIHAKSMKSMIKPQAKIEKPMQKNALQSISINELMQNPAVISLECKGPDIPLIMKTRAGPTTIDKILSLEEINEIINKFSEESHIPIVSEVFRAIVNNMMITASLSNPEAPQFIITKLSGK